MFLNRCTTNYRNLAEMDRRFNRSKEYWDDSVATNLSGITGVATPTCRHTSALTTSPDRSTSQTKRSLTSPSHCLRSAYGSGGRGENALP